jgi:hypothetical protein
MYYALAQLQCDGVGCEHTFPALGGGLDTALYTRAQVRKLARAHGWTRDGAAEVLVSRDFCLTCSTKRKAAGKVN